MVYFGENYTVCDYVTSSITVTDYLTYPYKQVDLKLINESYTFIDVIDIQVKAINERIQIKQYKLGLSINFLKQWTHYSLQQPGLQDVIGS